MPVDECSLVRGEVSMVYRLNCLKDTTEIYFVNWHQQAISGDSDPLFAQSPLQTLYFLIESACVRRPWVSRTGADWAPPKKKSYVDPQANL